MIRVRQGETFGQSRIGYQEAIRGHRFYTQAIGFGDNLPLAVFGTPSYPDRASNKRNVTEFGRHLIETVQQNGGPLIDLGCGFVVPHSASQRYVPNFASLAGVDYVGVDGRMQEYIESSDQSITQQDILPFCAWVNGKETYIQSDILTFLSQLEPLASNQRYSFYMSGIEFYKPPTGVRREAQIENNITYIKDCLREIKRLGGSITLLDYESPNADIKHVYFEEAGYRLLFIGDTNSAQESSESKRPLFRVYGL